MAEYLCSRCFPPDDRDRWAPAALAAAKEAAGEDGSLRDTVRTTVAWIWWNV